MRNIWILRTNAGGAYCTQYFIHANRMQNVVCDNKPACRTCSLFATSQIKFRVAHIKVFAVKFFLNQAEAFTEKYYRRWCGLSAPQPYLQKDP